MKKNMRLFIFVSLLVGVLVSSGWWWSWSVNQPAYKSVCTVSAEYIGAGGYKLKIEGLWCGAATSAPLISTGLTGIDSSEWVADLSAIPDRSNVLQKWPVPLMGVINPPTEDQSMQPLQQGICWYTANGSNWLSFDCDPIAKLGAAIGGYDFQAEKKVSYAQWMGQNTLKLQLIG